jgi:hypothetical protein
MIIKEIPPEKLYHVSNQREFIFSQGNLVEIDNDVIDLSTEIVVLSEDIRSI